MTNVLVNVDLSQAELRVMAILSNDEWMKSALQEGVGDFFDSHLMPVAFPKLVAKYGSIEKYKEEDPVGHKEDRTKVKAVQYGLAFGRQAPAIAASLGLETWEAQQIIDNYLATAEGFAQWRKDVTEAARVPSKRGLLVNPFGRVFQSEIITTKNVKNIEREALSFLPQSTSSDIVIATMIRIIDDVQSTGFSVFNLVHDAVMLEGPAQNAHAIGEYIGRELRSTGRMVMGDPVPFLSDYSIGKSWADLS